MLLLMNYTSEDPKQFNKQIHIETCDLVKYLLEGWDDFFPLIFSFPSHMKGAKGSQHHFRAPEGKLFGEKPSAVVRSPDSTDRDFSHNFPENLPIFHHSCC